MTPTVRASIGAFLDGVRGEVALGRGVYFAGGRPGRPSFYCLRRNTPGVVVFIRENVAFRDAPQ